MSNENTGSIIGKTYNCQFGNPGDTSGASIKDVVVLSEAVGFFTTYLVVTKDGKTFAKAVRGAPQVEGEVLYTTNARTLGPGVGGVWKVENAVKSLDFDLVKVVNDAVFHGVMDEILEFIADNQEVVEAFTRNIKVNHG